ncbi:bifunctional UDP-N-acetylglucosamine diphosphorylase/glucosamine-1-phosphate N-acetyltransferase GlmU [Candidatus Contubernalis alkaliaceticus]|uniref:bifunctional UDP-N-acetylglucosamine diphosphorylase/glucosamine-1-phosphate N-acetyltransferase GlmU n=1 Tax=Candidatus Contubernalis alkaliaceticus TaxID=338645 RepID=UPI001F4BD885|nr:bifunctional UDP-N-acetylglucosamine diphosphorylase/glucosamine-1-phosphate N-acetyltransferase GlmU [Candidatus Contubernalis alkalaceticus]UNC90697.1 bifunctional UDP-N-acetylglucosamine diphosphorylase/glucosamine-1-phosphate N-acetyltransferase GlmU [Candidatus Contubernalis alkalaceticus]
MSTAVILAAGEGTRMKSDVPKVLHKLCGKTMIGHVLDALKPVVEKSIVIIGHRAEEVRASIGENVIYAYQYQQRGTGHAVNQALSSIPEQGDVLIVCGDTPLLTQDIFEGLLAFHRSEGCAAVVLTANLDNPFGYGRIIRDKTGKVTKIKEEKDANEEERKIREINTGTYCVNAQLLKETLALISDDNENREYYLTDLVEILSNQQKKVSAFKIDDFFLAQGINTRVQLSEAEAVLRKRINEKLMLEGVTMVDPASIYIDVDVKVGKDTVIMPQTIVQGRTQIGERCVIGPQSRLVDSTLADKVTFQNSIILESIVEEEANIGPFAYIRPESRICRGAKVGDFVEIKKSQIGSGSKVPHLSYVGDTTVGERANLGAGTIIVNYDGVTKHHSYIEDGAFVGCNSNLIAPVVIGEGAYVAAGSTIKENVPQNALAIGRAAQVNKLKGAERLRSILKSKKNK